MDLDSAGSGQPGRNEAFGQGSAGAPQNIASSLNQDSAVFNSKVPGQFTAHSVLQPFMQQSGNGMSAEDAQRLIPGGMLPSANGASPESAKAAALLQLSGRSLI